jgi:hypothetical protein
LRFLGVLSIWLPISTRVAPAQRPIPVIDGQGLCATIHNSSDCAHAIEIRQISLSRGRVRRDSVGLHLRLANGRVVKVVDDSSGPRPTGFYYVGMCPTLGYYVLSAQYDEGSSIRLMNAVTGWSVFIDDVPIVSPDRRRFVTISLGQERYDPERLQVWRVEDDTLRKEWGFVPIYSDPHDVRWLSNRSFEFTHSRFEPTIAVVVDTAEIDAAGHWTTRLGP